MSDEIPPEVLAAAAQALVDAYWQGPESWCPECRNTTEDAAQAAARIVAEVLWPAAVKAGRPDVHERKGQR